MSKKDYYIIEKNINKTKNFLIIIKFKCNHFHFCIVYHIFSHCTNPPASPALRTSPASFSKMITDVPRLRNLLILCTFSNASQCIINKVPWQPIIFQLPFYLGSFPALNVSIISPVRDILSGCPTISSRFVQTARFNSFWSMRTVGSPSTSQ